MKCTDPTAAVCVRELRRSYPPPRSWRHRGKTTEALRGLDLDVAQGEVHGLLGPNGAGKTTLCRILATVLLPSSGSVRVLGYDVARDTTAVRRRIGVVFGGDRGLYPRLTARQNLNFWAALYGLPAGRGREVSDRLLERFGLSERADERVERYSRGMRQRLHLARGLVGDPALLLLDEPTSGMDPVAALEFRALVTELRDDGRTLLIATHNMVEAEQLCDRVTLIDRGRALATGPPERLGPHLRTAQRIEADDVPGPIVSSLSRLPGVEVLSHTPPGRVRLQVEITSVPEALRRLLDAGVLSLRTSPLELEEVYLALVGDRGLVVAR